MLMDFLLNFLSLPLDWPIFPHSADGVGHSWHFVFAGEKRRHSDQAWVTTFIDWFFVWFPKSLLMKITVATNQAARKRKWPASGKWKSLTHGELLRWLGMWVLMGVYRTSPRRMYWRGILGFGKWMSEKRFEQIMSVFSLPTYRRNDGKWGGPAKGKIKFDRMHLVRCFLDLLAVAWQKAQKIRNF